MRTQPKRSLQYLERLKQLGRSLTLGVGILFMPKHSEITKRSQNAEASPHENRKEEEGTKKRQ